MPETPWLSVVIPVYRAERTLERAVDSVISQGVPGVEIVCVDDDSPDDSVTLAQELANQFPQVKMVSNPKNLGPGATRNQGMSSATGDYIAFLDADDVLIEGGIASLKETINHTKADLILLGCEEERRGRVKSLTDGPLWESLLRMKMPTSVTDEPRVLLWPPAPWSKVYRRKFLLRENLQFGEGVAEDIVWSGQVTLLAREVAICGKSFYRYFTSETNSSLTTTVSDRNLIRLAEVRKMRERLIDRNSSEAVRQHLAALATIHLIWSNRAAYRLFPESTHERFLVDSAEELKAWDDVATVPARLDSRPLMASRDRRSFARALRRGDIKHWERMLQRHKNLSRLRRILRPRKTFNRR